MDEGGDGGGAFHSVGEPGEERDLRAFAGGGDEEEEGGPGEQGVGRGFDGGEPEGAEDAEEEEEGHEVAGVPEAVHEERFHGGVAGGLAFEVEADEQIAREADAFPADEQQEIVVGHHQDEHEEDEEIEAAEVAVEAAIVLHVGDGVDVDEEADAGDHEDHDGAEGIEEIAPVGGEDGGAAIERRER